MHKVLFVSFLFILCSCTHLEEDKDNAVAQAKIDAKNVETNVSKSVVRMADGVRDGIKRTNERLREWWLTPLPKEVKKPVPQRYCYRVLQDILCYRSEMPGWESRLVGYQGTGAKPPKPATMEPLQLRAEDDKTLPKDYAAKAQPVFTDIPEEKKDNKSAVPSTGTIMIDPMYEPLPNSVLVPQL